MLNLDDRHSDHIFAAARHLDAIMRFTLHASCSPARFEAIEPVLTSLRDLNADHFDGSPLITETLEALTQAIQALCNRSPRVVPAPEAALLLCPFCGSDLYRLPDSRSICRPCHAPIEPLISTLDHEFGCWMI
jgi:hypothetical protein